MVGRFFFKYNPPSPLVQGVKFFNRIGEQTGMFPPLETIFVREMGQGGVDFTESLYSIFLQNTEILSIR